MRIFDKNDKQVENGDIFDIHQTVNGQNLFVILDVEKLDVRYAHDLSRKYEYNKKELFVCNSFTGEVEFEVIGNINTLIKEKWPQY